EGLLAPALLEQLMGPHDAGARGRRGRGCGGAFLRHASPPEARRQGVLLLLKPRRNVRVDVREEALHPRRRDPFRLLDRPRDLVADLLLEPRLAGLVPPARLLEVPPKPGDRFARPPPGDLRLVPIPRRIVARGVRTESI